MCDIINEWPLSRCGAVSAYYVIQYLKFMFFVAAAWIGVKQLAAKHHATVIVGVT